MQGRAEERKRPGQEYTVHPSEQAQLLRSQRTVEPNSMDEELALMRIDQLRYEEDAATRETFTDRRTRFAKRLARDGLDPREVGRA